MQTLTIGMTPGEAAESTIGDNDGFSVAVQRKPESRATHLAAIDHPSALSPFDAIAHEGGTDGDQTMPSLYFTTQQPTASSTGQLPSTPLRLVYLDSQYPLASTSATLYLLFSHVCRTACAPTHPGSREKDLGMCGAAECLSSSPRTAARPWPRSLHESRAPGLACGPSDPTQRADALS